jgi:hypothetical protein
LIIDAIDDIDIDITLFTILMPLTPLRHWLLRHWCHYWHWYYADAPYYAIIEPLA